MKERVLLTACVVVLAAAFAGASSADPTNTGSSLNLVCGGEPFTVVFNGNGIFSAGHDVASTATFNPTGLDTTITFTPANGNPPSVDHAIVDKNASNEDTIVCTIPLQPLFTNADGSATIAGSVTGFWTPR
jgi:hypothetical protein